MKRLLLLLIFMLGGVWAVPANAEALAPVAPKATCASLRAADIRIPGLSTTITEASEATINGARVCQVQGLVAPKIRFEVRLPLVGWTQRYLQTGCGGLCGNLHIEAPQRACPALQRSEFVLASTDMGHQGMGGEWGADPQLRIDFAYRGVHATALVAKELIQRLYGQPPRWSYFSGCSDGGREALLEAQRYPGDFDGIAAGAPALNFLVQNTFYHAWNARTQLGDHPAVPGPMRGPMPPMGNGKPPLGGAPGFAPLGGFPEGAPPPNDMMPEMGREMPDGIAGGAETALAANDLPVLHQAAIAACDALDGVKDGMISDPVSCQFDPHAIVCAAHQTENCLSATAADAAAAIYRGAHDAAGRKLVVGALMPGSELSWSMVFVPRNPGMPVMSAIFAMDTTKWLAFPQPLPADWTLGDFRFSADTIQALKDMHPLYDATEPNLGPFAARGGKLIVWHGWSDPHISPTNSIAYYQAVRDTMGADKAAAMIRLFIVPGMYHCGSGDGLTSIDVLSPLMAWTEDGHAPEQVVASRTDADAAAGKGRPVYAWPQRAVLGKNADPELPESWKAAQPASESAAIYKAWEGASFFQSGFQKECTVEQGQMVCKAARH